jgi:hypothetical protein
MRRSEQDLGAGSKSKTAEMMQGGEKQSVNHPTDPWRGWGGKDVAGTRDKEENEWSRGTIVERREQLQVQGYYFRIVLVE